jgi:hypothetical protein
MNSHGEQQKHQTLRVRIASAEDQVYHAFPPPQLLYQGKTKNCHPKVDFPEEWDIWYSEIL